MQVTTRSGEALELKTYADFDRAAREGLIADDQNPIFAFGMVSTEIIEKIVSGEYDVMAIAKTTLAASRAYTREGKAELAALRETPIVRAGVSR